MKTCNHCGETKATAEFHKAKNMRDGLQARCKVCMRAYTEKRQLQNLYGITIEQRDEMIEQQQGKCAICLSSDPGGRGQWHVDHNHTTGEIRGMLCHLCNIGLGMFKDNPNLLLAAEVYLSHNPQSAYAH